MSRSSRVTGRQGRSSRRRSVSQRDTASTAGIRAVDVTRHRGEEICIPPLDVDVIWSLSRNVAVILALNSTGPAIERASQRVFPVHTHGWPPTFTSVLRTAPAGAQFAAVRAVARIWTSHHNDTLRVALSGRLSAADMGRLEHACAPALVIHPAALEIDVQNVTSIDRSAAAVLGRLAQRGARIIPRLPADES